MIDKNGKFLKDWKKEFFDNLKGKSLDELKKLRDEKQHMFFWWDVDLGKYMNKFLRDSWKEEIKLIDKMMLNDLKKEYLKYLKRKSLDELKKLRKFKKDCLFDTTPFSKDIYNRFLKDAEQREIKLIDHAIMTKKK